MRKKMKEESEQVSFKVPTAHVEQLRALARRRSFEANTDIASTDIIRQYIAEGLARDAAVEAAR